MTTANSNPIRTQLHAMLDDGNAHMRFDDAVAGFPPDAMNRLPPNVPYTPWHLLEHLRITQRDILDYIRDGTYMELEWPAEYWPPRDATADEAAWNASVEGFRADLAALHELVDASPDLDTTVRGRDDYPLVRGIITAASHNAYHIGEFGILRQVMGTWPADHDG